MKKFVADTLPQSDGMSPHSPNPHQEPTSGLKETTQADSRVHTHSLQPWALLQNFEKQYEITDRLGEGGMAAVFRATDHALHRTIAIKVMHEEEAERPMMVRRFYKEAQIVAQLEHPGIVPTYNIHLSDDGKPRLAMRLIRGQTLEELIEAARVGEGEGPNVRDNLHDRLELFARACDAVHFAHEHGVVHRDLKPSNIMVGPHRDAYVMDWGLATLLNEAGTPDGDRPSFSNEESHPNQELPLELVEVDDDPRTTRYGELMGTIAYMAPEQALGQLDQVGPLSDQFAMGMVLQELVTLTNARGGHSVSTTMAQATRGDSEPLPSTVPAPLAAIVYKSLSSTPRDRYPNMQAFSDEVRRFMRGEEVQVAPDNWAKKMWRRLSQHQTLALSSVLVLIVAVATLGGARLLGDLDRERTEALTARHLAERAGIVAARAQFIDARVRGIEMELSGLAGVVRQTLMNASGYDASDTSKLIRPLDLAESAAPPDTQHVDRYHQRISFERAVIARAAISDSETARFDESRLADVEYDFKKAYQRGGFVRGTGRKWKSALVHWTYAGTPSGILLSYPGAGSLKDDTDFRKRPWYLATAGKQGPVWGELYRDASGEVTLLPANQAVYDREGRLLAVVGVDFRLRDVKRALHLPEVAGYLSSRLLDSEGRVVAAPLDQHEPPPQNSRGKVELKIFQEPEVLRAIQAQRSSGQVVVGTVRYFYVDVPSLDWTYVVATKA